MSEYTEKQGPSVFELNAVQTAAEGAGGSAFLYGPAGTGKTTVLQRRLYRLLESGTQAYEILVLVSENQHITTFADVGGVRQLGPQSELKIVTYGAFAKEMIALLWPLIARPAGFAKVHSPPTFLGYDLAQLLMWKIIKSQLDAGMFTGLRLRPQQIVSQILDTLNRASLNGLDLEEAGRRQVDAWTGEPDHIRHLKDASSMAKLFRRHCLDNSLLDLSLIIQVFNDYLLDHPELHRYFNERYRHLIVDNIEEQSAAGQKFILRLLNSTDTAAMACDKDGGYKRFLGADPDGAVAIGSHCQHIFEFELSYTSQKSLVHLSNRINNTLNNTNHPVKQAPFAISAVIAGRYRREMVIELVDQLVILLESDAKPDQIAIIAPYLDGALRYSLASALEKAAIPYRITRRRSTPREEPRVRAWITWLALAHPSWNHHPTVYEVAEALYLSVASLDPARAQLTAEHLYDEGMSRLLPVSMLDETLQARVGKNQLNLVDELRLWLSENGEHKYSIDGFLARLFYELLALPRYQPRPDYAGAAICDWLVKAAVRLRKAAPALGMTDPIAAGSAFIDSINQGIVSTSPPDFGHPPDPKGITIATMYGYLLSEKPVKWQVWLDVGSSGWWDIPRQPLSNAFVLSRRWQEGQPWTARDDFEIRNQLLGRIIAGLTNRCHEGVILAMSDIDRRGIRQEGALLRALQAIL